MSPKKPKRVRICSLVTAEDKLVTWITEVGVKGKPSGTPIPPLFIMMAAVLLSEPSTQRRGGGSRHKEETAWLPRASARSRSSRTQIPSSAEASLGHPSVLKIWLRLCRKRRTFQLRWSLDAKPYHFSGS